VGGKIELLLPESTSAQFEITGHAGGKIINELSEDQVNKAKYGPGRWLEFSMNGGNAQVEASTVHGKILLKKQ
jgi:hypothetical protein